MSVNRRSFLKSGALSALTAAFGLVYVAPALGQDKPKRKAVASPRPGPEAQIPFGAQQSPLYYFSRETFQPYVGGIFVVSAGRKSVSMTLVEVSDYTPKAAANASPGGVLPTNSFGLKFSSADELTGLTTIYNVQHGALGGFPLFLTRRDGPAGTSLYEAVFNHLS
jgi:hypothetical protein